MRGDVDPAAVGALGADDLLPVPQRDEEVGGGVAGPPAVRHVDLTLVDERFDVGQCKYAPLVDQDGGLINDPVIIRVADDRFWLSIADSDVLLWARGLAYGLGLAVQIAEPDVFPLAVQGPLAEVLMADVFGNGVREIGFFRSALLPFNGVELLVARSGWSKQGGFELYLRDAALGTALWDLVREAGSAYGIGPGAPNDVERLESGLLSYGADARAQTHPANPFELGLGKLVYLDGTDDFIGKQALLKIRAEGVKRRLTGFIISGEPVPGSEHPVAVTQNGIEVGSIGEMAYSRRLGKNIAIGIISNEIADNADNLAISINDAPHVVTITALPFIG